MLWFLQGFGFTDGAFGMVEDNNNSLLAAIGGAVSFIFAPLGFGFWQATVATVTGLIAKENVVATLGQLFGYAGEISENGEEIWGMIPTYFTALTAYSFMIFNLLCAPCFAAMGAIKREMNNRVSLMVYQFGGLITGEVSFGIGTVAALAVLVAMLYLLLRKNRYEDSEGNSLKASRMAAAAK